MFQGSWRKESSETDGRGIQDMVKSPKSHFPAPWLSGIAGARRQKTSHNKVSIALPHPNIYSTLSGYNLSLRIAIHYFANFANLNLNIEVSLRTCLSAGKRRANQLKTRKLKRNLQKRADQEGSQQMKRGLQKKVQVQMMTLEKPETMPKLRKFNLFTSYCFLCTLYMPKISASAKFLEWSWSSDKLPLSFCQHS